MKLTHLIDKFITRYQIGNSMKTHPIFHVPEKYDFPTLELHLLHRAIDF